MTPKERYLKALQDPSSGITLDTPAHLIEGTVQQRFAQAAQEGIERARKMTHSQVLHQLRVNSGWYEAEARRLRREEQASND